ncbi:MAG: fibronectin type III domain-containing protein, partial [Candidatus Latescibacteria bacterium]|nr:fibronectin type III domain-containing protein [Candidatus Latescibacterota bacterium]
YRVQSSDLTGNTSLAAPVAPAMAKSFKTPSVADKTPPAITQISARLRPRPTPLTPKPTDDLLSTSTIAEISWKTSEAANTLVRFGQSPDLLLHSVEDGSFVRDHLISTPPSLTRLLEGNIRVIYYEISSTDASGNTTVFPQKGRPRLSLVEAESPDVPAEVIAPPSMGYISDRIGIITWSTNIPTTSQVIYRQVTGVPGAPYQLATRPRLTRNHVVIIPNLVPGTPYEYFVHPFQTNNVVLTRVSNGFLVSPKPNATTVLPGGLGRFTTNLQPDTQAPVIISGPSVIGRNGNALTIQWESDELSTSGVSYGVGSNQDQQTEVGDLVRNHVVTISGLDLGTTYSYRVQSVDPSGNGPSESALSIATTGAQIDITPPRFLDSPTVVGNTRVTGSDLSRVAISWKTDEPADTRFRYGTDDFGNVANRDGFRREHVVIVAGLAPGTGYSGQVAGTDLAGNGPSLSTSIAFTAATDIDNTAPVISSVSTALTTNKEITATWRTDEASLSFLRIIKSGTTDTVAVGSNEYRIAHSLTIGDTAVVRPGIGYTILLGSDDLAGNETFVNVGLVTTPAGTDNTPPSAPVGLVGAAGNTAVTLSWNASTEPDLAGYHVSEQLGSSGIGPVTQLATLHPDNSISVENLTNNLVYTYIVQAVDRSGNVSVNSTVILQPSVSNVPGRPFAASPFNDQIVSKKPILVSTVADRPSSTPDAVLTYSFVVFSDSLLTSVVASVSGIGEGIPLNPTHWQVVNSAFQDGVALVDNTRYWWQVRASSGNV